MSYRTREEIAQEWINEGLSQEQSLFYNLSHEEKSDLRVFEQFCSSYSDYWIAGYVALILSDDLICDNKELVLIASRYGLPCNFQIISSRLLDDPDVALALSKQFNQYEYTKINKRLRDNPELMLKAIKNNPQVFRYLTVKCKINDQILQEIADSAPYELRYLKKIRKEYEYSVFTNVDLALRVGRTDPKCLFELFYPIVLKNESVLDAVYSLSDPLICRKRILKYPEGIVYLDPKYWIDDYKLVINAMYKDGSLFGVLPTEMRNDKRIAMVAIKSFPGALEYCSDNLKDDEDVVKAALQKETEDILMHASDRLKSDYNVVYKAVGVDPLNLQYASEELRDNREIVLRAIRRFGGVLEDASERLQKDPELIRIAEVNR